MVVPDASAWRRQGEWTSGVARGGEPPYWSRIWLAAVAAGRRLARLPDAAGMRICDLGCGLGLPGVVAAASGAGVTFVDQEAAALAFAGWNATNVSSGAPPRTLQLDWSKDTLPDRYDLMILADVSYRPVHHAPLRRQIDRGLREGGVVLHVDPVRDESTRFLGQVRDDHAVTSFTRKTSFGDQVGPVRTSLIAGNERVLAAWCSRLGCPDPEAGSA